MKAKNKKKQSSIQLRQITPIALASLAVLVFVIIGITNKPSDLSDLSNEDYIEELRRDGLALYNDPHSGIQLVYSEGLGIAINEEPVEGVTFNMTKEDPRIQVTSWFEEGDSISNLRIRNRDVTSAIIENSKAQLAQTYRNIEIIEERAFRVNGLEASEMVFTYTAGDGTVAVQRFFVVLKNANTAVTIAFQTDEPDYEQVNKDYFEQIVGSIKF